MGRKRRYYREERRHPVYDEEIDDWGDEDEEDQEATARFIKRAPWWMAGIIGAAALLSLSQSFLHPSGSTWVGSDAYRVVSVSRGHLHTVEVKTGRLVSFADQDLVRQALAGTLKHGDVIYK